MTTDTQLEPTDEEIEAVVQACRARGLYEFDVFRAVVAKFGAPQPVEREPLTDEQIKGLIEEGGFFGNCKEIVRAIEAAHGIKKGGQHGTE